MDRQSRYLRRLAVEGFIRRSVIVHKEDYGKLKEYARELREARKPDKYKV